MKKKFLYGVLSAVIAVGLWLYVVTVVNPEYEDTFYNIPVVLENEDVLISNGLMLIGEEKPTVTLRIRGNRTDVVKLNSSNITLIADLSKISNAGEQALSYRIVCPGDVPNNSYDVVSQNPQLITLSVSEWKSKELDIQVDYTGKVPEQYIVFKENGVMDNSKITITGPSALVDQITTARINVDLEGQMETISQSFPVSLYDEKGDMVESEMIRTSLDEVRYTLKIQQWKDIELRLDLVEDSFLNKSNCQITIDPVTIRVSGSEKVLAQLDYLVLGQVRLGDLTEDFSATYDLEMPEGVTNLSELSKVSVFIKIPKLEMRKFTVTQINAVNIPDGMKVELITKEKQVTVRGTQEVLDTVTGDDFTIIVDFSDAEPGDASHKATVQLSAALSGQLGIVGSYEVNATVNAEEG